MGHLDIRLIVYYLHFREVVVGQEIKPKYTKQLKEKVLFHFLLKGEFYQYFLSLEGLDLRVELLSPKEFRKNGKHGDRYLKNVKPCPRLWLYDINGSVIRDIPLRKFWLLRRKLSVLKHLLLTTPHLLEGSVPFILCMFTYRYFFKMAI